MNNPKTSESTAAIVESNRRDKRGIKLAEKDSSRTRLGTAVAVVDKTNVLTIVRSAGEEKGKR